MKILLDTCTFLWVITNDPTLSTHAKSLFIAPENEIYLSSISTWEILVKNQLGKLPLPAPAGTFIQEQRRLHRIEPMPLAEDAVMQLPKLPHLHNDPFDRMLVCQAISNGLAILTPDLKISQYPVQTVW